MMRKVIEYLRRKQNITIEDLVVEICSSNMYYKYIAGTKNLSDKNLKLIKDRLGADDLTKEEVDEFKKDLDKITLNIMRFYASKKSFDKDIEPLLEIENQLILNEELIIPYLIVKINYLFGQSDTRDVKSLIELLSLFEDKMTVTEKLLYYRAFIHIEAYYENKVEDKINQFIEILENTIYNKDYGTFYLSASLYYIRLRNRPGSLKMLEAAIELFQKDINIFGLVKATNTKGILLSSESKHKEALLLFLMNYDNCKKINSNYEMSICLANIVESYLEINNEQEAIKYFEIFVRKIKKIEDLSLIKTILNNVSIGLITTFDYYKKYDKIKIMIDIIKNSGCKENVAVNKLVEYFELKDMDDIVSYAVNELLPCIVGKAHFAYCRWLIDKCVLYYRNNRMYKKAMDIEIEYVKVFQEYYYF